MVYIIFGTLTTWLFIQSSDTPPLWLSVLCIAGGSSVFFFPKHVYRVFYAVMCLLLIWGTIGRIEYPALWQMALSTGIFLGLTVEYVGKVINSNRRLTLSTHILSSIPDQNPSPVFRISFDGHILYANPAGKKHLNCLLTQQQDIDQEAGRNTDWDTDPDTDDEKSTHLTIPAIWQATLTETIQSHASTKISYQCRTQTLYFDANFVPVHEHEYIIVFVNETTELKRNEVQLREIISNVPLMFFMLDHEGNFTLSEGKGL
ncbi:MAG: PAS domain-containing protein, partial [Chloroflexota bacterium]